MKNIILISVLALFLITGLQAQNVKLVFEQHYVETDKSFDGEHLAFYDHNDVPYTVDDEGLVTGKWATYHENGNYESVGSMYKGEKNGLWRSWDVDGNLVWEAHFSYGAKDGNWKVWDEKGTLRYDMHYKNGQRTGVWSVYDASGKLIEERAY
jgi:antitoxin component YwqK of YwqJK toxin-antitoxin module